MLGRVAPITLAPTTPNEAVVTPNEAVVIARSRLHDARRRLVRRELPPLGHLIVRHRMSVPGGSEALWAIVSSWPDAFTIHGRSLNDGTHPALLHVRMGSPVLIHTGTVIDWAVIGDGGQIEEGGWTRGLDAARHTVPG